MKVFQRRVFQMIFLLNSFLFFHAGAQTFQTLDTSPLKLTYYNSAETEFGVTSVIISGKRDAILIDALFTVPDAEKLAAEVKKSGKHLTAVFITYGDPDYYFGLEVIKKNFPEVTVYATEPTVAHIKATEQDKLDYWGARIKNSAPKNIVLPQVLKGATLFLEGQEIRVVNAEGAPERDFIYIPSISAVIGGINVFGNNFHLWTADDASIIKRHLWLSALEKIISLKPEIVIPGHLAPGADLNIKSVTYTKNYLETYQELLRTQHTSTGMITELKKRYPEAKFLFALELSAKVNTGEIQW